MPSGGRGTSRQTEVPPRPPSLIHTAGVQQQPDPRSPYRNRFNRPFPPPPKSRFTSFAQREEEDSGPRLARAGRVATKVPRQDKVG